MIFEDFFFFSFFFLFFPFFSFFFLLAVDYCEALLIMQGRLLCAPLPLLQKPRLIWPIFFLEGKKTFPAGISEDPGNKLNWSLVPPPTAPPSTYQTNLGHALQEIFFKNGLEDSFLKIDNVMRYGLMRFQPPPTPFAQMPWW